MTEENDTMQYNVAPDEIQKLERSLESIQRLHAQAIREIQQSDLAKLRDKEGKQAYQEKRQAITDAHALASEKLQQQIQETKAEMRKNLALALKDGGKTDFERQEWAEAVRKVESADTVQKQEELIHFAVRWGDSALARAFVWKFGGQEKYKAAHEVLSQCDDRVKKLYEFEKKHGSYAYNRGSREPWVGWVSVPRGVLPDVPGRDPALQPEAQRMARIAGMQERKKNWEA